MIALSDNRTSLMNLGLTITELEKFNELIDCYSKNLPGPAYLTVRFSSDNHEIQIDRAVFRTALEAQRNELVKYLAKLGIDANA
jgi:hypothetical protein